MATQDKNFRVKNGIDAGGTITGTSLAITGGTASQFLKANGSVDSSTYLTTGTASSTYAALSGASFTGAVNLNYASPTIGSNNASAASIFTSTVTGITLGSSTIKTTAFPADGTTSTAAASAGYMGMPQVAVTSGGRTLAASDAGKHIYMTTTSGQTITIPANSATAFPIGTSIVIINGNGISTTINITTDTLRLANTATTGSGRTLASNGMCTLVKINTTEWLIGGNGIS